MAVVITCCAIAASAFTFLGPVCGVLLPAIVRSARELTVANVWIGACENTSVLGGAALATVLLALQGPALVLAGGAASSRSRSVIPTTPIQSARRGCCYAASPHSANGQARAALGTIAAASIILGIAPTVATATILLAVAGFSAAMLNLTSRMLLQRATPPLAGQVRCWPSIAFRSSSP